MWPNPQETASLVTITEETLKKNFIFVQWMVRYIEIFRKFTWKIFDEVEGKEDPITGVFARWNLRKILRNFL